MKSKQVILMALAVGCGLIAAVFAARFSQQQAPTIEMVEVLVAAKNLEQGSVFGSSKPGAKAEDHKKELEKLLTKQEYPKGTVPEQALTKAKLPEFYGLRLKRTRLKDEFVREDDLTNQTTIQMPPGKLGYGMRVQPEVIAGGFVLPGAKVDIALTEPKSSNTKGRSTWILRDVLVVAVDQASSTPEGANAMPNASTVTLALTPKEFQILEIGRMRGELRLGLRSLASAQGGSSGDLGPIDPSMTNLPDDEKEIAQAPETDKVFLARKKLLPNTQITSANFDELFKESAQPKGLPTQVIRGSEGLLGKYLTSVVDADMFVVSSQLDEKPMATGSGGSTTKEARKMHLVLIRNGDKPVTVHAYDENGMRIENKDEAK